MHAQKQQLFSKLNNNKRNRVQRTASGKRQELKAERAMEVEIDRDKYVRVQRVRYSEEQVEMVFHTLAHIAAIRDAQFKLKGTEFFSARMEREMELISSTKLRPIFEQNDKGYVSDVTVAMARLFSKMCQFSFELSQQPQAVQDRFHREYVNLLISCGISVS